MGLGLEVGFHLGGATARGGEDAGLGAQRRGRLDPHLVDHAHRGLVVHKVDELRLAHLVRVGVTVRVSAWLTW